MGHTAGSTQTHTAVSFVTWEPPGLGVITLSEVPDTKHSSLPATVRTSLHWQRDSMVQNSHSCMSEQWVYTQAWAKNGFPHALTSTHSSLKLYCGQGFMYAINSYVEKDRHFLWIIVCLLCVRFLSGGLMLIPKPRHPAGTCGSDEGCMTAESSTFPYCKGSWVQATGWEAVVLATQG